MKSIILIFCFVSFATAEVRVLGGRPAYVGQFPYQVSMQLNSQHHCGGSILSKTVVITAAHCVYGQSLQSISVRAGTANLNTGGYIANVLTYHIHPNYNPEIYDNDVALLILKEYLPVDTDPNVKAIQLVNEHEQILAGQYATISGWGQDSVSTSPTLPPLPKYLKYAQLPLWDHNTCQQVLNQGVTNKMFCAGSQDGQVSSCPGDSGGPLVLNSKLIGCVSWGLGCGSSAPAVYTNLLLMRPWIRQTVGI